MAALPLPTDKTVVAAVGDAEIADRAAIEATWAQFWQVYSVATATSPEELQTTADLLLVDPVKTQFVKGVAEYKARGEGTWGTIKLRPYWYRAIDGQTAAVIGDCRDTSGFGTLNTATGKINTTGKTNSMTVGYFSRGPDQSWRLANIIFMTSFDCSTIQSLEVR